MNTPDVAKNMVKLDFKKMNVTNDAVISIKDLTKSYKVGSGTVRAIENCNLEIPKGQMVSIVGHSGSGKTTLLSLMGGLTKPTSGRVLLDGNNIWTLSDRELSLLRNQKIGFAFQFSSLIPTLNSLDNVRLPATFSGQGASQDRAMKLLALVGLQDRAESYPAMLSGGEQRRVALARTLMNNPEIILADEPTGDLDEDTEADILEVFRKVNSNGTTIVIVTHSRVVASRGQRVLRMKRGHITEEEQ